MTYAKRIAKRKVPAYNKGRRKYHANCPYCHKEIDCYGTPRKFCSLSHATKYRYLTNDIENFGFRKGNIPWITGKKNPSAKNNPQIIKKGQHLNPSTEFKKGMVSWCAGKKNKKISGENNHNWKGGITRLVTKIRNCQKYKKWRDDLFKESNYRCVICGDRGKVGQRIEAHHIKSFSDILKDNNINSLDQAEQCQELWDIENGLPLCVYHHAVFDEKRRKTLKK